MTQGRTATIRRSGSHKVRVKSNSATPERIVDPSGFLSISRENQGLSADEHAVFKELKRKIQSGEIRIEYP